MLTSKPSKVAKVVICGMKSVGKTAILEQLIYGNVTPDTVNTALSMTGGCPFAMEWNVTIIVFDLFFRNCIQPSKIPMYAVLTPAVDKETFYAFMIRPVCKEQFRYLNQILN